MLPKLNHALKATFTRSRQKKTETPAEARPAPSSLLNRLPTEVLINGVLPHITRKADRIALAQTEHAMWKLVRGEVVHQRMRAVHDWLDQIDEAYEQSSYQDTAVAARQSSRPTAWADASESLHYFMGSCLLGPKPLSVFRTWFQASPITPEQGRTLVLCLSQRLRCSADHVPNRPRNPIDDHASVVAHQDLASLLKLSYTIFDRWHKMAWDIETELEPDDNHPMADASAMIYQFMKPSHSLNLDSRSPAMVPLPPIDLYFPNLTRFTARGRSLSTVPDELLNLPHLKALNLNGNILTRWPEDCTNFNQLTQLDLGRNRLDRVPQAIASYKNLRWLNLAQNPLSHIPEFIGKLAYLERLQLAVTHTTSLPTSITHLSRLELLDLSYNDLSELPDALLGLKALRNLYLRGNLLSVSDLNRLVKLPALEVLDVDPDIGPGLAPSLVGRLMVLPHGYSRPKLRKAGFWRKHF